MELNAQAHLFSISFFCPLFLFLSNHHSFSILHVKPSPYAWPLYPAGSRRLVQTDSPHWLIDKRLFNLCLCALDPTHPLFIWVLKSHWAVWSICLRIYRLLISLWSPCFMHALPCVRVRGSLPHRTGYLFTHAPRRMPHCRANFIPYFQGSIIDQFRPWWLKLYFSVHFAWFLYLGL